MNNIPSVEQLIIYSFTLFYIFNYREAHKTAINWGAFHLSNGNHRFIRFIYAIQISILPILLYHVFTHSLSSIVRTGINKSLLEIISLVLLFSFFPKALKHVWLFRARIHNSGCNANEWIHPNLALDDKTLPHPAFSIQMIIVFGFVPICFLCVQVIMKTISILPSWNEVRYILLAIYGAQIAVLNSAAYNRKYFYPDRPIILLYPRTFWCLLFCIIIPLMYGIGYILIFDAILVNAIKTYRMLAIILLSVSWMFPVLSVSSLHLLSRWRRWPPVNEHPEIYRESTSLWWVSLTVLIIFSLLILTVIQNNPTTILPLRIIGLNK